jgi:hypothetical protein
MISTITRPVIAWLVLAALLATNIYYTPLANAAALANVSDTLSTQTINAAANHTIVFRTPTGAGDSTDTIILNFPAGFNMNAIDFADVDLAHSAGAQSNCTAPTYTNDETLAAAAGAGAWGVALAGQAVTLTAPTDGVGVAAIAANACVQIQIGTHATLGATGNTQITNPSSANSYILGIAGAFSDTGSTTINILTDDQVDVAAEVAQSLTFSISDTSIGFGTLSASAARFATGDTTGSTTETEAHNIIVGTNAANGYTMTASGTTLTNASNPTATITAIGAANTLVATGTEQFGIRITASGGTGSVAAPYAAGGFAFDTAAFPDQIASATGATANTTYSLRYLGSIAANTDAGTYNAAITYVATANF